MACPFHYHLRRDAAGEGEADEGPAASVGADERPFGVGFLDFLAGAEEDLCYRGVESAEFAEVFQVVVHILVGDDGQGEAFGEGLVFVFLQYRFREAVEVYGEAVVGFLGGDVEAVSDDVGSLDFGHIRVAE